MQSLLKKQQGPKCNHANIWGCTQCKGVLLFSPVTCRWSQRSIVAAMLCPCTAASYYILIHTPKDTKSHASIDVLQISFGLILFWIGFVCRALSHSCRFRSVIRICSQYYSQQSYIYTFDLWRKQCILSSLGESSPAKKLTQLASSFTVWRNQDASLWLLWCVCCLGSLGFSHCGATRLENPDIVTHRLPLYRRALLQVSFSGVFYFF